MSRTRTRLILLGLLAAAVAVGVVASSSGAEPPPPSSCTTVTTAPAYCIAGVPLVSASEEVEGTGGISILKATVSSTAAEVECQKSKSSGFIEGGAAGAVGKSKTTITFEVCKLLTPTNCKLTSAEETKIKTTELLGVLTLTGAGKRIEDKLEPESGAGFAGISIEGKEPKEPTCAIAEVGKPKTFNVTGSQRCEVDSNNAEAETETEKHKITCKTTGGSLKLGGNKAEITDESTVELSGAKAHGSWSVKET
jgi:hypothetical protein